MATASGLATAYSTAFTTAPLARIAKPWGEELILDRADQQVVKVLRIGPQRRLSLQYHRRKHESLMLMSGEATLTIGPRPDALEQVSMLEGVREEIAAGVIHRLSAGANGAEILEIASRLPDGTDDVVRLHDDYGRAGTSTVD